jgi:2-oxoglutarate ferredoxin oxidoreductase subunit alpha
LRGAQGRPKNVVSSIHLLPEEEEAFNQKLQARLGVIQRNEVRYYEDAVDDAELVVVGFGTAGRVAQTAVTQARAKGLKVGLFRPISLFPFPSARLAELAVNARQFLVVEMNAGQMVEDVRLAVAGRVPVKFYGRMGGVVPLPDELGEVIEGMLP